MISVNVYLFFCIHPAVLQPVQPADEKRGASSICRPCRVWSPLASSMLCMLHLHWAAGGHDLLLEEGQAVLWSTLWRKRKTSLWRLWWGESYFKLRYYFHTVWAVPCKTIMSITSTQWHDVMWMMIKWNLRVKNVLNFSHSLIIRLMQIPWHFVGVMDATVSFDPLY